MEDKEVSELSSSNTAGHSHSRSNPSDANADEGRRLLNSRLRSIVMSRTCFDIFAGFNPTGIDVFHMRELGVAGETSGGHPNFMEKRPDGHLEKPARRSTKEMKITKEMVSSISYFFNDKEYGGDDKVVVHKEALVPGKKDTDNDPFVNPPRLDVTFGTRDTCTLLAFVEVGFTKPSDDEGRVNEMLDNLFWSKIHQSISYLTRLGEAGVCDKEGESLLQVKGAVLLCVLVADRDRTRGRMAVFVCERKGNTNIFRMAAVWRKEAKLKELDKAYGAFINAVNYLKDCYEENLHPNEEWKYLGPNCSKVTVHLDGGKELSFVLRSYDNRVRSTCRSPIMYKMWEKIKNETQRVLHVEDSGDGRVMEFRDECSSNFLTFFDDNGQRGKVEVIAVPFLKGSHGCTNIDAALSLVDFMQDMHKARFVHGDIRGFNIVFSSDTGKLIDHDFGGKLDEVVFPENYKEVLRDGYRIGCDAGTQITETSDGEALTHVLFSLHELVNDGTCKNFDRVRLLWYTAQEFSSMAKIRAILEEVKKIGGVTVAPRTRYKAIINAETCRATEGKNTLDGAPISPTPKDEEIQDKKKHKTVATSAAKT